MPAPRKYPLELRECAVRMYRMSEPKPVIRRMAEDIGVHHEALRGWIRQAEADAGERDDLLTSDERAEPAALRKENTQLKRSNEILRTASAFFAAQLDPTGPGDRAPRRAREPGGRAHPPGTAHSLLHLLPLAPGEETAVRTAPPGHRTDQADPADPRRLRWNLRLSPRPCRPQTTGRSRRPEKGRAAHARSRPRGDQPAPARQGLHPSRPGRRPSPRPGATQLHRRM